MAKSRKRRSVDERLAIVEAEKQRLQMQKALKDSKEVPGVSDLSATVANLTKELNVLRAGFRDGAQSFNARRESHELWINVIQAEERYATVLIDANEWMREQYKARLAQLVDDIATGKLLEEHASEAAENISAEIESDANKIFGTRLNDLEAEVNSARALRLAVSADRKAPKKAKKSSEGEASA